MEYSRQKTVPKWVTSLLTRLDTRTSRLFLGAAILLAIIAGVIVWYAMNRGPWAYSDSVSYIEAGRNLAEGRGLAEISASGSVNPFLKQPPLLPVLLAFFHLLGADLLLVVRWMNTLLFGVLVASMGLIAFLEHRLTYFAVPLLWLTAPIILEDYTGFMSEPLYFTTGVIGLLLLACFFRKPRRIIFTTAAVLISLSVLTRYAGSVFVATGALGLLLFDRGSTRARMRRLIGFLLISAGPLVLWVLIRFPGSGHGAGAIASLKDWWSILSPLRLNMSSILSSWLPLFARFSSLFTGAPQWRVQLILLSLAAMIVVALLAVGITRVKRNQAVCSSDRMDVYIATLFATSALIHMLFLITVTLLGPWEVRIDTRQLSPVYLCGFTGAFLAIRCGMRTTNATYFAGALQAILVVSFILHAAPDARAFVLELHTNGRGYTSAGWQSPALLDAIEQLPAETILISNDIEGIMFFTGHAAYRLPELQTSTPARIEEVFGSNPRDMLQALFRCDDAVLVLFNESNWRFEVLYGDRTEERIEHLIDGLDIELESPQGRMYSAPSYMDCDL